MPKVKGTHGNIVTYEVLGMAETIAELTKKNKLITTEIEIALARSATFVKEEVKESIAGHRPEEKSVDTGNLLNSIQIDKLNSKEFSIGTDVEYAKYLEYGTNKMNPRSHFTNTAERSKETVAKEIDLAMNKITK